MVGTLGGIYRSWRLLLPLRGHSTLMHSKRAAFILEAITCDQQVGLGHPEDVVDGPGCKDLPHGLRYDICRVCRLHFHTPQEANDEELVEDRV